MDGGDKVLTDKNDYLNITIFDCLDRINSLEQFKAQIIAYRDRKTPDEKFQEFRSNVNQRITIVEEYVATSYTPVLIGHKFPGTMDHIQVAMFREIFNPRFDGHIIQAVIDHLDMAIGRYKHVRFNSVVNTISPLYWMRCFAFWLTYTVADLLSIAPTSKKFSLIKFMSQLVTFLAAIAGIYSALATYFGKPSLWF